MAKTQKGPKLLGEEKRRAVPAPDLTTRDIGEKTPNRERERV